MYNYVISTLYLFQGNRTYILEYILQVQSNLVLDHDRKSCAN